MEYLFARRLEGMRRSTIREILKTAEQPEVISFAGGLPAPELFPVEAVRSACDRVLSREGSWALQYGASEGYTPLREYLVEAMAQRGVRCKVENVQVTSGSQQALDLLGRCFLNPGDVVLTENPTYLAAIQAFQGSEARFVPVPTDDDGLIPEALPELVARHRPRFLYTIPNFQNPTGITMPAERRRALYETALAQSLVIMEDDPYGLLRYSGEHVPPIKALDTEGLVIYASTFSKTIAPGLRVGWLVADVRILEKFLILKQAADLHTSSLDQRIACEFMTSCDTASHLARIRTSYGTRYQAMDAALRALLPERYQWTHPQGGMFLWVTCPEGVDTWPLMQRAVEHKVLFVPGCDFFPDGGGCRYMRLNFSNSTPERIQEGVARLAQLLRE
ncbi:MAG TPA: PLP-dependent aminotransferase family protein [Armatimonadetes bacterium]|jgi:2-aminoadipate transaminase|nr:PLP-dependent aminotransferase family protein [Armatimonadota bacterium]